MHSLNNNNAPKWVSSNQVPEYCSSPCLPNAFKMCLDEFCNRRNTAKVWMWKWGWYILSRVLMSSNTEYFHNTAVRPFQCYLVTSSIRRAQILLVCPFTWSAVPAVRGALGTFDSAIGRAGTAELDSSSDSGCLQTSLWWAQWLQEASDSSVL